MECITFSSYLVVCMPKFDVVTGVSTGALLSVFAFLEPQYDKLDRKLYTTQTNDQIFKSRGLNGIRFHMTSIPDEIPISEKSLDFDPKRMQILYDAGYKIGLQGPDNWNTKPPSVLREAGQLASN